MNTDILFHVRTPQCKGTDLSHMNINNVLHCHGCTKKCEYASTQDKTKEECAGTEFYIWPENNPFLIEGILQYFTEVNSKIISKPIIAIDFNYKNLDLFLDKNWLKQFENARLILIADKKMAAIAHYWFYNDTIDTVISAVIFHDDITDDIKNVINQAFMGKIMRPSENRVKLSTNEYTLFSELCKGQLPKKIALKNATNVKNIYAMKIRIENKLGVPISRFTN